MTQRFCKVSIVPITGPSVSYDNVSKRVEGIRAGLIDVTVERGFLCQSLHGIQTFEHKYQVKLANADGALDDSSKLWREAYCSVYAGDTAATMTLRFARKIKRVTVTTEFVIVDVESQIERWLGGVVLAEYAASPFVPLGGKGTERRPWCAGRVTCYVEPISDNGTATDFDTGSRSLDLVGTFVDGQATSSSAPAGSGKFSFATGTVNGKRVAARVDQPSTAARCTAYAALADIFARGAIASPLSDAAFARGSLDDSAEIGLFSQDGKCLETVEKLLAGFDGGIYEASDGTVKVALLDLLSSPTVSIAQRQINPGIECEDLVPAGLGKILTWNQNDAEHGRGETSQSDPNKLFAKSEEQAFSTALNDIYEADDYVKSRKFETWLYVNSTTITGNVAHVRDHLLDTFDEPLRVCNFSVNGHEFKDLDPGTVVAITHNRLGIGTNKPHQILSLRYSEINIAVSISAVGKYG